MPDTPPRSNGPGIGDLVNYGPAVRCPEHAHRAIPTFDPAKPRVRAALYICRLITQQDSEHVHRAGRMGGLEDNAVAARDLPVETFKGFTLQRAALRGHEKGRRQAPEYRSRSGSDGRAGSPQAVLRRRGERL